MKSKNCGGLLPFGSCGTPGFRPPVGACHVILGPGGRCDRNLMQMRDMMNMPMAMPTMAPIKGPAEEFGDELSRRERMRGGAG